MGMGWWKGMTIECGKENIMCETMYDVLDKLCRVPERPISAPMRMPISGIYKIKGAGDVLAGRVEQGQAKPGDNVGLNIKGLDKQNMPRGGDVMVYKKDT